MVLPTLLVQIALILVATHFIGWILGHFQQPRVVGEMIAGILLGPSLLGLLLPDVSAAVFPAESLSSLNALSQTGLLLFMFLVGLEFDPQLLRGRRKAVIVTSQISIVVPFCFGAALAFYLYPALSPANVPVLHFVLFTGLAMSITAFPVLARILTERQLLHTQVGTIAIACAAVNDITAWCLLAAILPLIRTSAHTTSLAITLFGVLVYIAVMFFVVRRVLHMLDAHFQSRGEITHSMLTIILMLVISSALITELLGIHAIFGAFLIGVAMPKDAGFRHALSAKLEAVTVTLLLPLFFAFTGLRTSVGFLRDATMWSYCIVIIGVAIVGKLGGTLLGARRFGMSWREAGALGILMNTRGLIEFVFLNIGLDIGVISPTFFTIMVLMALVTTLITTPLLRWVYPTGIQHRISD